MGCCGSTPGSDGGDDPFIPTPYVHDSPAPPAPPPTLAMTGIVPEAAVAAGSSAAATVTHNSTLIEVKSPALPIAATLPLADTAHTASGGATAAADLFAVAAASPSVSVGPSEPPVVVAVLDSGIYGNTSHAQLKAALLPDSQPVGRSFVDTDRKQSALDDPFGHGTHIAGIVIATSPNVRILSIKILGSVGSADATAGGKLSWVAAGFQAVIDYNKQRLTTAERVSVVCCSFSDSVAYDPALPFRPVSGQSDVCRAINTLAGTGVVIITATGNAYAQLRGKAGMSFPAVAPNVVSVGAVFDPSVRGATLSVGGAQPVINPISGQICPFSQRSAETTVFAAGYEIPSVGLLSTAPKPKSGTSQSAAFVAGLVAQIHTRYHSLRRVAPPSVQAVNPTLPPLSKVIEWLTGGKSDATQSRIDGSGGGLRYKTVLKTDLNLVLTRVKLIPGTP